MAWYMWPGGGGAGAPWSHGAPATPAVGGGGGGS